MRTLRGLTLLMGLLAAACTTFAGPRAGDPGVIGAIVTYIDAYDHYMVVEWPGGRTLISMDPRELSRYRIGSDIALDAALRPLPPR